jgi:hypothetical protein
LADGAMKQKYDDSELEPGVVPANRPSESAEAEGVPREGDFHPIKIKGEPLSTTIIRERREGW